MAKTLKCPKCGEMIDPRGARFHIDSDKCKEHSKKIANRGEQKKTEDCKHTNKRLLNRNDPNENFYIEKYGFTEVCIDCLELLD